MNSEKSGKIKKEVRIIFFLVDHQILRRLLLILHQAKLD